MLQRRQIAGMNCHYIQYPLDYFLDQMADLGFEQIELWGASPHFYIEEQGTQQARAVRKGIEARGLSLVCFTPEQVTYPVNIAAEEPDLRRRSINYYLKAVTLCAELGTNLMLLTPGWGYRNRPIEQAWRRSLEAVGEISRLAEREGVRLALEHLSPISSNLVNRAQDIQRMLNEVASPALKAMLDTVQVGLVSQRCADYFELLGEAIVHLHFVDGTPGGHLALGDGTLLLEQELEAIDQAGYRGALTLEIADRRYFLNPVDADRRSLKRLEKWGVV